MAERAQYEGERLARTGDLEIGDAADRGHRHQHVDQRANRHRSHDADGEIAPGILGFLRRGGHRVEAVESEEHDRRRRHDAPRRAVLNVTAKAIGHEGLEIVDIEKGQCQDDKGGKRGELDHHQHDVEGGALARARDQHARHRQRDQHRGQVDDPAAMRPGQQQRRQLHAQ